MAITNAQQYQQLVNKPANGKRPGYKGREDRDSQYGGGSYDSSSNQSGRGQSFGGNSGDKGRDTDFQQRGMSKADYNKAVSRGDIGQNFSAKPNFFEKIQDKAQTLSLKNLYDTKTGAKKMSPFAFANYVNSFNPALEVYESTDEDDIMDTGYGMTGKNLTRTDEIADAINKSQTVGIDRDEYLNAFFGNNNPQDPRNKKEEGGDGIQDPCRGPNPPAYCFVGIRSAEAATPVEEEDEIINYRLMADGGRAAFGGGSDMGSVADSKGNVGPGTGGYQGGELGGMGRGPEGNTTNGGSDKPKQVIEKFPSTIRAIDKMTLDKMIANMNLNTVTTDDDDEDTNVIDTVFSEKPAADLQTVFGTGLSNRQQIEKNILDSMADGGRAGLAEGGMPYEGGIMDLESARQMYGLGKLVKKVTRGVKKIAKSPIGKAALGAALFKFGGGFAADGFFKKTLLPKLYTEGAMTGLGKGLLYAGVPAVLSGLMTEEEEEQKLSAGADIDYPSYIMNNPSLYTNRRLAAEGGSMDEPVAKKTMPLLDMDGKEMDLRAEGGFVPLGRMERADDVPARLSKNEFVFTADAVRNAGEGDVDKGAEVMYNMMKNLESGGEVSEESQGLEGARDMFQTSQRLEEVI